MEVLKQNQNAPVPVEKQVAILYAVTKGVLEAVKVEDVSVYESGLYTYLDTDAAGVEVMQEIRNLSNGLGELDNLITLASIIQKEATDLENMKMVSSVFHNRLNNSSTYPYLQSDATTNYIRDDIRSFMTQDNQEMYDAYDTTKVVGLPVGPICNPGMDAIEAAIHPADTNYYYFVSDDAGTYYFAATLEEHEANIRKANQVNEQLKSEAAVEETGE
mgnify:FL=1